VLGQQFDYSDTGMWLPTSEIRSRLNPELCITPTLSPYVNDTLAIRLAPCGVHCHQLWLLNAMRADSTVPTGNELASAYYGVPIVLPGKQRHQYLATAFNCDYFQNS
jgi:hypothetical protein